MKSKIVNLPYKMFSQGNPLKLFLGHSLFRKYQKFLETNNPVTRSLISWTAQVAPHTFSYILHEIMHTTRVVTLTEGELGTISKYSLRGIALGIRPIFGGELLNLQVYCTTNKQTKALSMVA